MKRIQAAVVIYWIAGNIWTIGQQEVLSRFFPSTPAVLEASATDTTPAPPAKSPAPKTPIGKATGALGTSATAKSVKPANPVKSVKPANPVRPAVKKQSTAAPASGAAANTRKKK